jgi:hypothetical protein
MTTKGAAVRIKEDHIPKQSVNTQQSLSLFELQLSGSNDGNIVAKTHVHYLIIRTSLEKT